MPSSFRRLFALLIGGVGAVLLCAPPAWAKDAIITRTDGTQIQGEVVSDNIDGVTLRISGIPSLVPRAEIKDVQYVKSIAEQFQEHRAAVPDSDYEARYKLAKWAFDNDAYDVARKELDGIKASLPADAAADLREHIDILGRAVDARIKLRDEQATKTAPKDRPKPGATTKPTDGGKGNVKIEGDRVTDEMVNAIRVLELPTDVNELSKLRINVPDKTVDKLLQTHSDDNLVPKGRDAQSQLKGASSAVKADLIFQVGARELYPEIQVREDPPSMREFRAKVHRNYVINYCGTVACHGGEKAGSLFIFTKEPSSDQTVYSNFLSLHLAQTPKSWMINRDTPADSLLVQYGIPRAAAKFPHPDVRGWRPQMSGLDDAQYHIITNWISMLYRGTVRYPIRWTPPSVPKPAAQTQADMEDAQPKVEGGQPEPKKTSPDPKVPAQ